jgi:hypothetical protein
MSQDSTDTNEYQKSCPIFSPLFNCPSNKIGSKKLTKQALIYIHAVPVQVSFHKLKSKPDKTKEDIYFDKIHD